MSTDIERFWALVDRSAGPEGCWPWIGRSRNKMGYGGFYANRQLHVAHRWLLGHLRGEPLIWPGEVGCHRCDNPPCCNPAHLYIGSHSDNTRDAIERSGHPAGITRAKTHCVHGHEYLPENTHWYDGGRRRYCRTCKREQSRESMRKQREKKRAAA